MTNRVCRVTTVTTNVGWTVFKRVKRQIYIDTQERVQLVVAVFTHQCPSWTDDASPTYLALLLSVASAPSAGKEGKYENPLTKRQKSVQKVFFCIRLLAEQQSATFRNLIGSSLARGALQLEHTVSNALYEDYWHHCIYHQEERTLTVGLNGSENYWHTTCYLKFYLI